jgi:hypothetical protein
MVATDAPALDELIPLKDLAALLPRRRGGKKTHVATLFRWTTCGLHGQRLRYVQVGNTRCSTVTWAHEFFAALAAAPMTLAAPLSTRTPAARQKAIEAADRELERRGVRSLAAGLEKSALNLTKLNVSASEPGAKLRTRQKARESEHAAAND